MKNIVIKYLNKDYTLNTKYDESLKFSYWKTKKRLEISDKTNKMVSWFLIKKEICKVFALSNNEARNILEAWVLNKNEHVLS